nr:hypothetical protein [Lachnospiraceae bacterium]
MEEKIKRNEKAIAIQRPFVLIIVGIILFFSLYEGAQYFDLEQARLALGETYDLSEGWTVTFSDGRKETDVTLPYTVPAGVKAVALERDTLEEYAGLAMSLYGTNCGVKVFTDDMPLFSAGNDEGDIGTREGAENISEGNEGEIEKAPTDISIEEQLSSLKSTEAVGEVVFDLPDNLKDDSGIRILLGAVDQNAPIVIQSATVAKRDVTIISILGESVFALICIVVIIIAAVILIVLDVLRAISGRRLRGLWFMAMVTIDAILICFIRTGILSVIFDNRVFFQTVETLCMILFPIPHIMFFRRGFRLHFPRLMDIMLWTVMIISGVEVFLMVTGSSVLTVYRNIPVYVEITAVVSLVIMLYKWRLAAPQYRKIGLDVAGLICLGSAMSLVCIENEYANTTALSYIRLILMTVYFVLVGG